MDSLEKLVVEEPTKERCAANAKRKQRKRDRQHSPPR
jgi:hypothetical protein